MSQSKNVRRLSQAEKPSGDADIEDDERRDTSTGAGWGISSRSHKISKITSKKDDNVNEIISSDEDHRANSDATSDYEEKPRKESDVSERKPKIHQRRSRAPEKILSTSQSHDSEDLEHLEFVNLKDLSKLQRIESDFKGNFLSSTHKFERPITGFCIRVKLLKYPSFAERSKWPGELLVIEDRVFSWQEKVFSKSEHLRYSETKNLKSDLDQQYHKEIEDNPESIGAYLHTYIDNDYYVIRQEEKTLLRRCPAFHYKRSKKISGISSELKSLNSDGESILDDDSEKEDPSNSNKPLLFAGKTQKKLSEDEERKQSEKAKKDEEKRQKEEESKEAKRRGKEEKELQEALKKSKKQQEADERHAKVVQQLKKEMEKRDATIKKRVSSSRPSEAISARTMVSSSSNKEKSPRTKKASKKGNIYSQEDSLENDASQSGSDASDQQKSKDTARINNEASVKEESGKYEKLTKKDKKLEKSRVASTKQVTKNKQTKAVWRVAHRRFLERSAIQPPQTMYIMATIPHMTRQKREIAVCVIKAYPKLGIVVLKPPFGYRIIEAKRNHIYRLSWEPYFSTESMENNNSPQVKIPKSRRTFTDVSEGLRKFPFRAKQSMGSMDDMIATFEVKHYYTISPMNELKLIVMGEIVSAEGFDTEPLCVHYLVELPKGWKNDSIESNLQGITHSCFTTDDKLAYFSHPFSFQLAFSMDSADQEDTYCRPLILLMVVSLNSSGRVRYEGYGYINIPSTPGSHIVRIQTWKPKPRSIIERMQNIFLDVSPSLQDIHAVHIPVMEHEECKRANRLGLQTEPSGFVKFRLNIIHQTSNSFKDPGSKLELLEKMSSATILKSVQAVIEAFHRARHRALHVKDSGNPAPKDASHIL